MTPSQPSQIRPRPPAHSPRKIETSAGVAADEVVLDLQDAVLPDHKPDARAAAVRQTRRESTVERWPVRVNQPGSHGLRRHMGDPPGAALNEIFAPSEQEVTRMRETLRVWDSAGDRGAVAREAA